MGILVFKYPIDSAVQYSIVLYRYRERDIYISEYTYRSMDERKTKSGK